MDVAQKLRKMMQEQSFAAFTLRNGQQLIGTVAAIDGENVMLLDHAPNEVSPIIHTTISAIADIKMPAENGRQCD
jgi:hypothetical protein